MNTNDRKIAMFGGVIPKNDEIEQAKAEEELASIQRAIKSLKRKKRRSIYEMNFERLEKLGIIKDGDVADYQKFKSDGFMDLVVEKIMTSDYIPRSKLTGGAFTISLAHYYKQNGDMCTDPEQQILIDIENKTAEALTFEMSGMALYQEVYKSGDRYIPQFKKEHNSFLKQWLTNIKNQGHTLHSLEP